MPDEREGTTRGYHTSIVDVGTPTSSPLNCQGFVKTTVYIHDFAELTDREVTSPRFSCLGYNWSMVLFPHGHDSATTDVVTITLRLCSTNENIIVEYGIAMNDNADDIFSTKVSRFRRQCDCGHYTTMNRSAVLRRLVKGVFIIVVRMRPTRQKPVFVPTNPSACKTVQDLFMDMKSSDVIFEVGGGNHTNNTDDQGGIETPSSRFYAHFLILKSAAPILAEIASTSDDSPRIVEIPDVSSDLFKAMLLYMYGFEVPALGEDNSFTQNIIRAADKYGLVYLKLEAEAYYVSSTTMTSENVMEHLQFACSNNCAYLKERAIDFIAENQFQVLRQLDVDSPESCLSVSEIFACMARRERQSGVQGIDENEYHALCIVELRRLAHTKGLDVDGSRESLISALESGDDSEDEV